MKDQEKSTRKEFESMSKQAAESNHKVIVLEKQILNSTKDLDSAHGTIKTLQTEKVNLSDTANSCKADLDVLRKDNKALLARMAQIEKFGSDDTNHFEVEKLLEHKTVNELNFLVKWKGFDRTHNSWVRRSDLGCTKMLNAYLKKNGIK